MKDTNNKFKVNLDMKDILVTEEQRLKFLQLHNKLKETIDCISECHDIRLSEVSMLDELLHHLHSSLKFVPQKDSCSDSAKWYADYVLESDETAWKSIND